MNDNDLIRLDDPGRLIRLGVWDTKNVAEARFDVSEWLEAFPGGELHIIVLRPGETNPYEAAHVSIAEGVATWTFDAVDTGVPGSGSCALLYSVGQQARARSTPWTTRIARTLLAAGAETPEPLRPWVDRLVEQVGELAGDAEDARDAAAASATAAAGSATAAADSATAAASSASAAHSSEVAAASSMSNAHSSEVAAASSKTQAANSASAAAASATAAADSATAAASSASAAHSSEVAAASSMSNAHSSEVSAASSKTQAANSASAAASSATAAAASAAAAAQSVLAAFPHATASGSPASFSDGADGIPVRSLIANIPLTQGGSGTPAPDNACPFTGYTELTLSHSGEDTQDPDTIIENWGGTAGSVFSANLNVLTGDLTVDWILAQGTVGVFSVSAGAVVGTLTVSNAGGKTLTAVKSSHFSSDTPAGTVGRCSVTGSTIYFIVPRSAVPDGTAAQIESWLQTNGVVFLVHVSEAFAWSIFPADFVTRLGVNNIWTDVGNVDVDYRADPTLFVNGKINAVMAVISEL